MAREVTNLEQLLDRISKAAKEGGDVSLGAVVRSVGTRSFAPLLLVAGVVMVSPLSGIPGMPTIMGLLVLVIAVQLLARRDHFWLPGWLLRRSVEKGKLCKALEWMRRPARFIDRWIHPRLTHLVNGVSVYVVALICVIIAAAMPFMELVPFSATAAGVALSAFALSFIAHDGAVALVAFAITASAGGAVVTHFV